MLQPCYTRKHLIGMADETVVLPSFIYINVQLICKHSVSFTVSTQSQAAYDENKWT